MANCEPIMKSPSALRFPFSATYEYIKKLGVEVPLPPRPDDTLRLPRFSSPSLNVPIDYFEHSLLEVYDFFMHPLTPLILGGIYFLAVQYLNTSKPNQKNYLNSKWGKTFIVIHNALLAVYSGWTFINVAPEVFASLMIPLKMNSRPLGEFRKAFCFIENYRYTWTGHIAPLGYLFYLSKYWEIIDSAIILAKGKKVGILQVFIHVTLNLVIFNVPCAQCYHHYGAIVAIWSGLRFQSQPIWMFIVFNSAIHTLMCKFSKLNYHTFTYIYFNTIDSYYTAATLHLPFPKILKRSLTTLQISQFLIGGSLGILYLFLHLPPLPFQDANSKWRRCVEPKGARFAVFYNIIYLAPLSEFFFVNEFWMILTGNE